MSYNPSAKGWKKKMERTLCSTIKKIFSSKSEKKDQKSKFKRIWTCWKFTHSNQFDPEPFDSFAEEVLQLPLPLPSPSSPVDDSSVEEVLQPPLSLPPPSSPVADSSVEEVLQPPLPLPPPSSPEAVEVTSSMAPVSAITVEAVAIAAQPTAQVACLIASSMFAGRSREDMAAIKIQSAFRGCMARRLLRALRGLVRLKKVVEGDTVKRQATNTLCCMQTMTRVQFHSRRIRMVEDNYALQRQQQLKCKKELERSKLGGEWDDSLQSKEQIEANLLNKQEAAIRRERAHAYAYSHQWKSSSRSRTPTFTDPTNPHWGWSWLERRMAARPWENPSMPDKDLNDHTLLKSAGRNLTGDTNNAYARRDSILERTPPTPQKQSHSMSRKSPSTPPSKASSAAIPRYMASTESARAKSRFQSPSTLNGNVQTLEMGSLSSAKKRSSFPKMGKYNMTSQGGMRRHTGPPKVNISPLKDVVVGSKQPSSNGLAMD